MGFSQFSVQSATIRGVTAVPVRVEVMLSDGLPSFSIVGMPDAAIIEARERVRSAIKACGFRMPVERLVVNLAPGSLKKTGSGFDLPIALGILAASGQIDRQGIEGMLAVGELSLDGDVCPVRGTLAFVECAKDVDMALLCSSRVSDYVSVSGVQAMGITSLRSLRTGELVSLTQTGVVDGCSSRDFANIQGHAHVKRALQLAAAGGHGVLMMGPPGSGKSALAACLPSILPPLSESERLEAARIRSVVGEDVSHVLAGIRPFRAPHHSATLAGLVGGGTPVRPGELSLAHTGVLFLDEIAEFRPSTLQGIRIPIEKGYVRIVRADGSVVLPSRFMLVAASNPCPCGYFGDDSHPCTCTQSQIHSYQNRIGGPLLDRIDMHVDVWRIPSEEIVQSHRSSMSSASFMKVCERHARSHRSDRIGTSDTSVPLTSSISWTCALWMVRRSHSSHGWLAPTCSLDAESRRCL